MARAIESEPDRLLIDDRIVEGLRISETENDEGWIFCDTVSRGPWP